MDRLHGMQAFARVVELESFTRAAESLALSRARVSELVQALETSLGTRLLHRTTRRVAVTDDGRAFYARVARILADVAEAEAEVLRSRSRARGLLRVGAPFALGRLFLGPKLAPLLAANDQLALEIVLENHRIDLVREGLDCAITYGPPMDTDWAARHLAGTQLVTCAAPSYLDRRGRPASPEALLAHDSVLFLSLAAARPEPFQFTCDGRATRLRLAGRLAFNSMEACVDAASAGLGVTQVLSSVALEALRDGRLEPLLLDQLSPGPDLFLAVPPGRQASARLRVFTALCERVFRQADAEWTALVSRLAEARARAAATRAPRAVAAPRGATGDRRA